MSMPMCWQWGGLGEERLGLPWASHRWFHLAPKGTTAGQSWALRPQWWHLGGNIVKEEPVTMPHRQKRREQEDWETAEDTPRSKEMVLHTQQTLPYSPWWNARSNIPCSPWWTRAGEYVREMDSSQWKSHTGAGEKWGEGGRAERTSNGLTTELHSLSPLHCSEGGKRSLKWQSELGPGKGGGKEWF